MFIFDCSFNIFDTERWNKKYFGLFYLLPTFTAIFIYIATWLNCTTANKRNKVMLIYFGIF